MKSNSVDVISALNIFLLLVALSQFVDDYNDWDLWVVNTDGLGNTNRLSKTHLHFIFQYKGDSGGRC